MPNSTPDFGDTITRIGDYARYPRRVLLQVLESGFSSEHFFTEEGQLPNPYLYKKDGKDTALDSKIEIADGFTNELAKTDPRPVILCRRVGDLAFADSSIAAREKWDWWGEYQQFADFLTAPLVFECYARIDVQSEEIAVATAFFLRLFREHIRSRSKLFHLGSPSVGVTQPVKADSKQDLFMTPVPIMTNAVIRWRMKWEDLALASDFDVHYKKIVESEAPATAPTQEVKDFWSNE